LINFIVDLPSSNGFMNIIVVVDCLIKMGYMVPIDLINAILVTKYFVKYVFKLHRLHQDFFWAGCCGLRRFTANRTIAAVVYSP
jgi:hypothetical protein